MEGTLSPSYGLADAVKGFYVGGRAGVLDVRRGEVRKRLYFQKGSFIFSDSNDPDWRLGQLLVQRGKLSAEDLERVLALLSPEKRIGAVMVGLGLLEATGLQDAVEYQITENVYPMFAWPDGEFVFEEMDQPAPADISFAMSTANVIMEGVRRIEDPSFIEEGLGSLQQVVSLGSNPLLRFQSIFLKPKEGFVLSRIDGLLTVDEICAITPVPQVDVLRCLYGLKAAGILEVHAEASESVAEEGDIASFFSDFGGVEEFLGGSAAPPPGVQFDAAQAAELAEIQVLAGRLSQLDHYEVLGITVDADEKTIRQAYYRLAKTYHPDRHHRSHLSGIQDKLERIFVRVNKAYEVLRDGKRRGTYERKHAAESGRSGVAATAAEADPAADANRRRATAESRYNDGRHLLEQGDTFGAIRVFRQAAKMQPDNATYRSFLGRALGQNPKWRKEAEENLLRAIEIEPSNGAHYAELGAIYLSSNLVTKAEKFFAEALSWDAGNETARRGMEQLAARKKGSGSAGIGDTFRSLFDRKS